MKKNIFNKANNNRKKNHLKVQFQMEGEAMISLGVKK